MQRLLRRRAVGLSVAIAIVFSVRTTAALQWQTTRVAENVSAFETQVHAQFPFENTGTDSVSILSLTADCECVTATASLNTVAPGQAGSISVVFTLGDRRGHQRKRIEVRTDESPHQSTYLEFDVEIADAINCFPRTVTWQVDGPQLEKTIDLVPIGNRQISTVTLRESGPNLIANVEVIQPGRRYRLRIRPRSTANPERFVLQGAAHFPGARPMPFFIYGTIQ